MLAAPIPADDALRVAALLRHPVSRPEPDAMLDMLARTVAVAFDAPIALVTLIEATRHRVKAGVGLELADGPRDLAICGWTILEEAPLVLPDLRRERRTADHPLVRNPPHVRFYAGVPLRWRGHALGALCIMDRQPRQFRAADMTLLRQFGRLAVDRLGRSWSGRDGASLPTHAI